MDYIYMYIRNVVLCIYFYIIRFFMKSNGSTIICLLNKFIDCILYQNAYIHKKLTVIYAFTDNESKFEVRNCGF